MTEVTERVSSGQLESAKKKIMEALERIPEDRWEIAIELAMESLRRERMGL